MQDGLRMPFVEGELTGSAERHDFDAIFRSERDGVYRTLFAFTGGRADVAEEATAEAFARAFARRDELRDPVAWVYRVAFNLATDELRRDRRRREPEGSSSSQEASGPSPELTDQIEAIRALSPNQRAAVVLRYVGDLEIHDIARRMGMASPTVRVHLHRARTRLRELLGDQEDD